MPMAPHLRDGLIVGAVALGIHAAYLYDSRADPTADHPIIDAHTYHRLAQAVAAGEPLADGVLPEPPLYPYMLGMLYRVTGPNVLVARCLQALLGTGTCLLAWSLGRRVFSDRAGLLAGLLTALAGPLLFFNTQLLATGLVVFLNVLALRLFIEALHRQRWDLWLVTGLTIGLAALAKPNILVPAAVAVLGIAIAGVVQRSWRRAAGAGLLAGAIMLCVVPVIVRNHVAAGEGIMIAANGGVNFYLGNNTDTDATLAIRPGAGWSRLMAEPAIAEGVTSLEGIDGYYFRKAVAYVREQPGDFVRGLAIKIGRFFHGQEVARTFNVYLHRDYSTVLGWLVWCRGPVCWPFGVMAPLAAVGAVIAWKKHPDSRVLAAYVLLYGASVAMFFVTSRYRQPVVPVVAVLAAHALCWVYERWQQGQRRVSAAGVLAAVAVGTAANWPARAPADGVNFRAELHHFVGLGLHREQDMERAGTHLRRAIELDPDYVEARVSLATLLMSQQQAAPAIAQLNAAVAIDPGYAHAHYGLGMVAIQQKDWSEAAKRFAEAVRLMPTITDGHHKLAVALLQLDRTAEAIPHLQQVVETDPANTNARRLLAIATAQSGEIDVAERTARSLLDDDPNDAYALYAMGKVLHRRGETASAVRHYQAAQAAGIQTTRLTHDLGDALLARGETALAVEVFLQAVAQSPDDPHLHARLAEAYAAASRFDDASHAMQEALSLASPEVTDETLALWQHRAECYRQREPCTLPSP